MKNYSYKITEMADILHQSAALYMSANFPIDYGTGEKYTSTEVHTLKYIIDNPGKSCTELAKDWDKTKAAVSLMMKKLEQKDLILKKTAPDSEKKQLFYPTPKGLELNKSHMNFDKNVFGETINFIKESCTDEEIGICFHVLEEYIKARRRKHYRSPVE